MTPLDTLARIGDHLPVPATSIPAAVVWLAVEDGRSAPGWDELRAHLMLDRCLTYNEAETLILEALRSGEAGARLSAERTWTVRVSERAARVVLLGYAARRLDAAGLDIEAADAYDEDDRWLVTALLPELAEWSEGITPPPRPAHYRRLLREAFDHA